MQENTIWSRNLCVVNLGIIDLHIMQTYGLI